MDPHHPPPLLLHSHRQTPRKPTNPAIAPTALYVSHHLAFSRAFVTDFAFSQTEDGKVTPHRAPSVPSERALPRREPGGLVNAMPFLHNSGRHSLRCVYPIHRHDIDGSLVLGASPEDKNIGRGRPQLSPPFRTIHTHRISKPLWSHTGIHIPRVHGSTCEAR